MRNAISAARGSADHVALAYGLCAPPQVFAGDDDATRGWLDSVCRRAKMPPDYRDGFAASAVSGDLGLVFTGTLVTPLLVGHGNPSPTEVGLTLHHTWGVPFLPGTALKGLVAQWVHRRYGGSDIDRVDWSGPQWEGSRVARGPGRAYREIFGSPDADEDRSSSQQGSVVFLDCLPEFTEAEFLRVDVVTPHQTAYHRGERAPNDYEDPIPVPFLSVRPGLTFRFQLLAPKAWHGTLERLVKEALSESGAGGKTAAGYGRFAFADSAAAALAVAAGATQVARALEAPFVELAPVAQLRYALGHSDDKQTTLWNWARVLRDLPEVEEGHPLAALWGRLSPGRGFAAGDDRKANVDTYRRAFRELLESDGDLAKWRKGDGPKNIGTSKLKEFVKVIDTWTQDPRS